MIRTGTQQLGLALILVLTLAACGVDAPAGRRSFYSGSASLQKFVHTVLLGAEYGGDGLASRYIKSPRVSVFSNVEQHSAYVEAARSQLNAALAPSSIRVLSGARNDATAEILVYFAPMRDFKAIAQQHSFQVAPGNSGFFWSFWGNQHEILKSVILIATDYLSGSKMASVVLEELTQSMGLVGDQSIQPDSIFYETATNSGYQTQLGEWDINIIRLLYGEVEPGADAIDVDNALATSWGN